MGEREKELSSKYIRCSIKKNIIAGIPALGYKIVANPNGEYYIDDIFNPSEIFPSEQTTTERSHNLLVEFFTYDNDEIKDKTFDELDISPASMEYYKGIISLNNKGYILSKKLEVVVEEESIPETIPEMAVQTFDDSDTKEVQLPAKKAEITSEEDVTLMTAEIEATLANLLGGREDDATLAASSTPSAAEKKEEESSLEPTPMPEHPKPVEEVLQIESSPQSESEPKKGFWSSVFNVLRKPKTEKVISEPVLSSDPGGALLETTTTTNQGLSSNKLTAESSELPRVIPIREGIDTSSVKDGDFIISGTLTDIPILKEVKDIKTPLLSENAQRIIFAFRKDMQSALDSLMNVINLSVDPKGYNDRYKHLLPNREVSFEADATEYTNQLRNIKIKLGIIQDFDLIQKTIESRNMTIAKIAAFGSKIVNVHLSLKNQALLEAYKDLISKYSQSQKESEYKRLIYTLTEVNNPNLDRVKRIAAGSEQRVINSCLNSDTNMLMMEFTKEIAGDIEILKKVSYCMKISADDKKQLIDIYHQIDLVINSYRREAIRYNEAQNEISIMENPTQTNEDVNKIAM